MLTVKTRQAASSCLPYRSDTARCKLSIICLVYNAIDTLLRFPSGCDYNYHPRMRTTAAHCEATRGRVMASATSCLVVPNCNGGDTADAVHHDVTASTCAYRRWQYDNSCYKLSDCSKLQRRRRSASRLVGLSLQPCTLTTADDTARYKLPIIRLVYNAIDTAHAPFITM